MSYFTRKNWNNYKMTDKRKEEIFKSEDNVIIYEEVVKEMSKITHLPRCICSLVYDAEELILKELGLIK